MDPQLLQIKDFTYELPPERIAKYPLPERDLSKLLVYKNGAISQSVYREVADFLPSDALLIFNNTKVVEARLLFKKASGGMIEIFCFEPGDEYANITSAMLQQGKVFWKCLVGGASKWKRGAILEKKLATPQGEILLQAEIIKRLQDYFVIGLSWMPIHISFAEILHLAGQVPLPPYLQRQAEDDDKERYQTIYARYDGSVAAPTAGLHFTDHIFEQLKGKGIHWDFVTLHVGAGTFKPVKSDLIAEHEMHSEFIDVTKNSIENIKKNLQKAVIAVGTTSLRTIESLYWLGLKVSNNPAITAEEFDVHQWEPYQTNADISAEKALDHLINWMEKNGKERLITKTRIMIAPGYNLKIATALITNFHQPQSTLLLLIAAIAGEQWKEMYAYALKNDFRFLSYGDGCLIFKQR